MLIYILESEDWLVKGTSISRQEKSSERHSGQEGFTPKGGRAKRRFFFFFF